MDEIPGQLPPTETAPPSPTQGYPPFNSSQPTQLPANNQKNILSIIFRLLLLSVVGGGAYYFGTLQNKPVNQITQQPSQVATTPTSEIPQPSPAQVTTENPSTSLTWKTQKINIEEDTELTGKITINMEMKLPSDWIFKTTPVASSTDNMITNCSTYTATSNDKLISLTLQPICRGWAAKTSSWPADAVIAFHRDCAGNDGNHTCYRVRTSASSSGYSYVDSVTEPNRPLNKSQDKVMDGLMVGYAPPNDSTGDYFFIPSHLTVTYSGSTSQKENYLSIADQIAASITLR